MRGKGGHPDSERMIEEKDEMINELERDRDERARDKERMAVVSDIIIGGLEERRKTLRGRRGK